MNSQYQNIVELSARKYIEQLGKKKQEKLFSNHDAISALINSYQSALEKKLRLSENEFQFSQKMLRAIPVSDREYLINQYSLGLGASDAPVIFVGTEHAYNLTDTIPLALEAIGSTALWLSDGHTDLTSKLLGSPWQYPVPFHIHPNALYRVHQTTRGQHTWKVLSSIMAPVLNIADYRQLLNDYSPGLGTVTYQIEMSAYPSKQTVGGKPPTNERIEFLANFLVAMRETAKVLVFHGKPGDKLWNEKRNTLSRKFLSFSANDKLEFTTLKLGKSSIRFLRNGKQLVIYTKALNGAVSNAYRENVSNLIREYVS